MFDPYGIAAAWMRKISLAIGATIASQSAPNSSTTVYGRGRSRASVFCRFDSARCCSIVRMKIVEASSDGAPEAARDASALALPAEFRDEARADACAEASSVPPPSDRTVPVSGPEDRSPPPLAEPPVRCDEPEAAREPREALEGGALPLDCRLARCGRADWSGEAAGGEAPGGEIEGRERESAFEAWSILGGRGGEKGEPDRLPDEHSARPFRPPSRRPR